MENRENANQRETRQNVIDQNSPEILTNSIYTPAFLREQIGKLVRVEFLIRNKQFNRSYWNFARRRSKLHFITFHRK